jgi:hypothetical protein
MITFPLAHSLFLFVTVILLLLLLIMSYNELGEFGTSNEYLLSNISLPHPKGAYEINPELIMSIENETFVGDPEGDPYKHIYNFTSLCSLVKLSMLIDDELKLKLFTFSLKGKAKEWFCSQPEYFESWQGIYNAYQPIFLTKEII